MKSGANVNDQRLIAQYFRAGHSAEDISVALAIDVNAVRKFEPGYAADVKAKIEEADRKAIGRPDLMHGSADDGEKAELPKSTEPVEPAPADAGATPHGNPAAKKSAPKKAPKATPDEKGAASAQDPNPK